MKIAFAAFSAPGWELAGKLAKIPDVDSVFFDKDHSAMQEWLSAEFNCCDAVVFIGAVGIAVRYIAPFVVSKDKDPAVIVIDVTGRFVIPILSGHLGGGNALALKLAALLDAVPVITTATDLYGKFAVDVWSKDNGCVIDNIGGIKYISAAILRDEPVAFCSDFTGAGALPDGLRQAESGRLGICLSLDTGKKPFDLTLKVMPKILVLGAGCRKNTSPGEFEGFVSRVLAEANLSMKAICLLASLDLKKEEPALTAFAQKYKIPFFTFSSRQLKAVNGEFSGSRFVEAVTGVDNVCERAAVMASGGRLLMPKTACGGMTLAAASFDWRYSF